MNFPWLTALIAIPAVGALVVALLPAGRDRLVKQVAMLVSLLTLVVAIGALTQYDIGGEPYQLVEQYAWIASFGVYWSLGLTGISAALIALTAVATPLVLLAMWHEAEPSGRSSRGYFALMLLLEAMVLGAFAAIDLLLFYVLFEAMLIPMYFLIGLYGGARRRYAAIKFLLYNLFGGLLMLAAVIGIYVLATQDGEGTFLIRQLATLDLSTAAQGWLFAGFMIAFAIKAPLWPFHTWLPDAAAEATPSNAAYLSGIVDKVGTYGMIALVLPLFPAASERFAPVIVTLAVISILYGALLAIGQVDMKRLIAYTSVSHFGFIVVGIFALTNQGGSGATFYMVNHGLSTTALFLIAGFMIARRGSVLISDYGGVQKPAPVLSGVFLFAALSGLALPGLSTFVSEILVLVGTFSQYRAAAVFATVGIILAALYMLWLYQRTMTGPVRPATEAMPDLRRREIWAVAPLLALILALGVFPKPMLDVINHGVEPTLEQVGVADPQPLVPASAVTGTAEGTTK